MSKECVKVKFGSKKFADDWIERLQKKSKRDTIPCRSYRCNVCGAWHLTSQLSSTKKATVVWQRADEARLLLVKAREDSLKELGNMSTVSGAAYGVAISAVVEIMDDIKATFGL